LFLRTITIKRGKRTYTYLKLVESVRQKKKVVQRTLVNFGNLEQWSPEKLQKLGVDLALLSGLTLDEDLVRSQVNPRSSLNYGPFLLADCIWKRLELSAFLQEAIDDRLGRLGVEMALKVLVFNRLFKSAGQLALQEWVKGQCIPGVSPQMIRPCYYSQAMKLLEVQKERLEDWIFPRIAALLQPDSPRILCNLILHTPQPASLPLPLSILLLLDQGGVPLSHFCLVGEEVGEIEWRRAVRGFSGRSPAGEQLFLALDHPPPGVTLPPPRDKRWQEVGENLRLYQLPYKVKGQKVFVVFDPRRMGRENLEREERINESLRYLASWPMLAAAQGDGKEGQPELERWLRFKGTRRYFLLDYREPADLRYQLDRAALTKDAHLDGIMTLFSNREKLPVEEVLRGYRLLTQVQTVFAQMKGWEGTGPQGEGRSSWIKPMVAVRVIAYLIESVLERILRDADMKFSAREAWELFAPLKVIEMDILGKRVRKTTLPTEIQLNLLRVVGLDKFNRCVE